MKYTFLNFLFHDLTIKQAVENASGYWDTRLVPLHLTSQVEQISTEEMDKTQFYASFVSSIVAILSQRLVIQGHYNDTLPDQSKCCKKQSWQVLSRLYSETITAHFTISFALEVYTGRTD